MKYLYFFLLAISAGTCASTVELDFDVKFNYFDDWATEGHGVTKILETKATVIFDIDVVVPYGTYFWEDELQSIMTKFGSPVVTSEFLDTLPVSPIPDSSIVDRSIALASNTDYGVSYPEGPHGVGPYLTYQFNYSLQGSNELYYWDYIVGFSLAGGGMRVNEIESTTAEQLYNSLVNAKNENYRFQTGFNSRVLDVKTYEPLWGSTYLGEAYLTDVRMSVNSIPTPQSLPMLIVGIFCMSFFRKQHTLRDK